MRKVKYFIPLVILFITIGFAAVNQTLSIKGNVTNVSNVDDFTVYFSDVLVNDVQDLTLVKSDTELVFTTTLAELGNQYKITYDITNASKYFDASFTITCTESNNYLKVTNEIDTSNIESRSTRTGTLTLEKTQTNAQEESTKHTVTCTIIASPVERETVNEGDVPEPLKRVTIIGDEVSIGTEKFNIISLSTDTATLLTQYNISSVSPYTQTATQTSVRFSETAGWEYTPGPKEIDVQTWGREVKTVLNGYVDYLNSEYDLNATGDLITLAELGELGCTVPSDYAWGSGGWTCASSKYSDWLVNNQHWWTRSASSQDAFGTWLIDESGLLKGTSSDDASSVRPIITISKETLDNYL